MTNNKQSMKLYTENQVRTAIRDAYWCCSKLEVECVFDKLPPIVLPSDEEIVNKALEIQWSNTLFIDGAKYVIDKIQGCNK